MNYRRRNKMQHKVELPTSLKIVMANKTRSQKFENKKLIEALAVEALKASKKSEVMFEENRLQHEMIA